MAETLVIPKTYTRDQYFEFKERATGGFEHVNGQIIELHTGIPVEDSLIEYVLSDDFDDKQLPPFAMPTRKHDDIVSNLHFYLRLILREKGIYQVYSQQTGIYAEEFDQSRNPDIIVTFKTDQQRSLKHEVLNPIVLIEVLSKSTQKIDKTDKLEEYQSVESLQEYLMVSQYEVKVILYRKLSERKWEEEIFLNLTEKIELQSLQISLNLSEIYEGITFEK